MRLSTVYTLALATAVAPAAFAIPLDASPNTAGVVKDNGILHELARRLDVDESGALSDAVIQTVLEKRMPKSGGGSSSKYGGSSRGGGSSSSNPQPPAGGSLLGRIGPPAGQQPQQPGAAPGRSLLDRISAAPGPSQPYQQPPYQQPPYQQPPQRQPHNVHVQFQDQVLAKQPAKQTHSLNQVERHMQDPGNAPTLRGYGTTDVIIHTPPHKSAGEKKVHSSYAAYNQGGHLVQGGHAPGALFTPTDPNYVQKWGHIGYTNPSAGGQQDRHVDISGGSAPPPASGRSSGRGKGKGKGGPY